MASCASGLTLWNQAGFSKSDAALTVDQDTRLVGYIPSSEIKWSLCNAFTLHLNTGGSPLAPLNPADDAIQPASSAPTRAGSPHTEAAPWWRSPGAGALSGSGVLQTSGLLSAEVAAPRAPRAPQHPSTQSTPAPQHPEHPSTQSTPAPQHPEHPEHPSTQSTQSTPAPRAPQHPEHPSTQSTQSTPAPQHPEHPSTQSTPGMKLQQRQSFTTTL
ncbi:unnamed protein product [Lota lota]